MSDTDHGPVFIQVRAMSTGDEELNVITLCMAALMPLARRKTGAAAAVTRYLYDRFDYGTHDGTGRGLNDGP